MGKHALNLLRKSWADLVVEPVKWVRTTSDWHPGEVWGATVSGIKFTAKNAETIVLPKNGTTYSHFQFGETDTTAQTGISHLEAPAQGSLICGDPVGPVGSQNFRSWFECDDKFVTLLNVIRDGTSMSESELGVLFAGRSDHFWALLRLVLFDNVEAFVDCAGYDDSGSVQVRDGRGHIDHLIHPAFGFEYYRSETYAVCVDWDGMYLPSSVSEYVHELSWRLETPEWWNTYRRLMGDFLKDRPHPLSGGICRACKAENPNAVGAARWPYLPADYD